MHKDQFAIPGSRSKARCLPTLAKPHRARGFACPKPLASPRTPRRSRNPRWLMKQIGYTQDSHPCSTFEPRHPCLGYANLQQRQRRLRRGNWCNSAIIALLEIAYISAEIRLFSRHRITCAKALPRCKAEALQKHSLVAFILIKINTPLKPSLGLTSMTVSLVCGHIDVQTSR